MNHLFSCYVRSRLLLAFAMFGTLCFGQDIGPNTLGVMAKAVYGSDVSITLRWSPANFRTWEWCRDSGYVLVRVTLKGPGGPLSTEDQAASLLSIHMPAKTQSEWEAAMLVDSIVGVAAGAYYGEDFTVATPGNEGIITAHNINSEKENRFGMSLFVADISTLAAKMQNMYYRDTTVIPGNQYAYIIRPGGKTGANQIKAGRVSITAADPYDPPTPFEFGGEAGDSVAMLRWNQQAGAEHYACYNVWRAVNNGPFECINAEPLLPTDRPDGQPEKQMLYYARLDNNTDTFRFRIAGHSPFGFDGPFSPVVSLRGIPAPLKTTASISTVTELSDGMEIKWEFPDSLETAIQGFNLLRAAAHGGPYIQLNAGLINRAVRTWTDGAPLPTNYYQVELLDANNNRVTSLPRLAQPSDSIPPDPPVAVSGSAVGGQGMLEIRWSPSPSADVMGYRVFVADQPNGNYGQATSRWLEDTVFRYQVNLSMLSERKYFKVKAIDFRENASGFSPVCAVVLPDIVPPAVPVLKKAEPQSAGVLVEFAPSRSADLHAHRILRKKKDEPAWTTLETLDSLGNQANVAWLDTTAEPMYSYDYMVQAVDDAGLESNSKVFRANWRGGERAGVQQFEARFVKSEAAIRLNWKYSNAHGVSGFAIYRGFQPDQLYESAFVAQQQVLKGGQYSGPDPFAAGAAPGSAATAVTGGHLAAGDFNLKQAGAPNVKHVTAFEHLETQFIPFRTYYYAIAVKFDDGTCSPLSAVRSVSGY